MNCTALLATVFMMKSTFHEVKKVSFTIENNLSTYFSDSQLQECLSEINEVKKCENIPVVIHSENSVQKSTFIPRYSHGIYGGDLGVYHADSKAIEMYACNFLSALDHSKSLVKLTILAGLLHEFRHAIQHQLMPKTFQNIVDGVKVYHRGFGSQYREQYIEKDARKFVERTMNKYHEAISESLHVNKEWKYKNDIIEIDGYQLMF